MRPTVILRGVNAARSRDHNRQLVLGHLRAGGPLGRAELARRSGLSTQAVSNIIAGMEEDGLLRPEGARSGRRGLPAMQYTLNAEGAYAFGVEIRPTVLLAALLDFGGTPVWQRRLPLSEPAAPEPVAEALRLMVARAGRAVPRAAGRILGAGVVMPGPFGRTGVAGHDTDLPGWDAIDPAGHLTDALRVSVTVEKDANAAAMSERISFAAEDLTHFGCLYFGAGLGLGIVHDGRPYGGAFGNAGEIGHIPIPTPDGPVPLESRLSRLSAERHLRRAGHQVADIEGLERLYLDRDPDLMAWLDAAEDPLHQAVAIIENLIDPQTIILNGAMPEPIVRHLVDRFTPPARSVARRSDNPHAPLRIGTCSRMTAALGAAALVLNRSFTPALAS
ncbi:ROK family transcriptional regulator [Jannaschia sp. S6380]|uniref:ROK family transcriptional regulator n=1 Tax=Jannaschia sp. S6380 TaxID=2926408 RepID=UPI001FF2901E|nr:ROK family transcriptional regulator [Jannaschia sp. S6380]MCK0168346.1 ROK family transcriptional regulator [Jannaschia sp. S6380]